MLNYYLNMQECSSFEETIWSSSSSNSRNVVPCSTCIHSR